MIPVVGNLSEERSGTVGGRTEGVSTLGVRLTEGHVVDGSLCIYTYVKEVGSLLALLVLGVVDFLTEQEREIVLVFQRHVVAGGIGPSVRLNGTLGQLCYGLLLVNSLLTCRGQPSIVAFCVAE